MSLKWSGHVPFCEPVQQVCAVLTSFRAMIPQAPWADFFKVCTGGKGGVVGETISLV